MKTHSRSEGVSQLNQYLNTGTFKMETLETIRISLQKEEWVTSLDFSNAYFHIPIYHRSRKYMRFFLHKQTYQFTALPFHPTTAPLEYMGGQGSETYGTDQGYKNPPIPRRLATQSPFPGNVPTTHPEPLGPLPQTGLGSEHGEIRTNPSTGFQFCWLPVRPVDQSGFTNSRKMGKLASKIPLSQDSEDLHSQAVHVLDRTVDSHRKASVARSSSHEAHTVAPETTLASSRNFGKGHSPPNISSPAPRLVAG